ncbi:MAG: NUDIX hydrolase [Deltaproteobacteria bacterium]|nr:NUDIX hydrolase [Deltaproteobacteria bacterium]PWB60781.1 MAG: NUDIX hydrolase [Deltaproteobacteria bacterium]
MHSHWTLLASRRMFSDRLIAVDHDRYLLAGNGRSNDFTVIRTSDWINVIPVTPDGQLVFIRQFRHGIREVTVEIPGGAIDARDADPRAAAQRELLEETGYRAGKWEYLGYVTPNPALQDNRCHTYLARDAVRAAEPEFDPYERIEVALFSREDAERALRDGTVTHGLVLAAFGLYFAAGYTLR